MRPEHWLFTIPLRLRSLFRWAQADQELDDELRDHLARKTEEYVAKGITHEEAHRRARLDMDGIEQTKEKCRDVRRVNWIQDFAQDLRYALRILRQNPGFTAAAAVTLALGVGANTAIFSIVNAVILRPLPYKDSARVLSISTHTAMFPTFTLGLSWPACQEIQSQASSLEQTAIYLQEDRTLTGKGDPAILSVARASDGFFAELGATAEWGRLFTEQDQKPGHDQVAVISDALWRSRFAANPFVSGQTLILDKQPYTVIGVAARGFDFPEKTGAWLPLSLPPEIQRNPTYFAIDFLGKLRRGQKMEKLDAELDTIAQRLAQANPELRAGYRFSAKPLIEDRIQGIRKAYLVLLGAATLVLLISCANLASLLLARGSNRQREMALRAALGASRGRLLRQGLVESCLLAFAGGALGAVLAAGGVQLFRATAPADTPRLAEISLDSTLLWFSMVISLLSGVLFGIVPARRAARMDPNDALKEGASAGQGATRSPRQSRLGAALVTVEVALAFVLLIGSALMTLTVARLLHQNPGFRTDHLLTFDLPQAFTWNDDPTWVKNQTERFKNIIEQVRQVPGLAAVTASDHGVLTGMTMMQANLLVDGAIPARTGETRTAGARYVYPLYFRVLGIPLLRGREFTDHDTEDTAKVVIVNEAMAREYWGSLDVLGKRIGVSTDEKGKPVWHEVVGIVPDVRDIVLRSGDSPAYFLSFLQGGTGSIHLLVRTRTDPDALAAAISRRIWSAFPDQPITHLETMSRRISESVGDERLRSILLFTFAAIGFALALVGVYGVISYAVARRFQEIGIRMALGASPSRVLRLVLARGLLPVIAGVLAGAGVALALARIMANQLYGVQPTDPTTFLGAAALVLIVAFLACLIPARRAMRVDPMVALRYE